MNEITLNEKQVVFILGSLITGMLDSKICEILSTNQNLCVSNSDAIWKGDFLKPREVPQGGGGK